MSELGPPRPTCFLDTDNIGGLGVCFPPVARRSAPASSSVRWRFVHLGKNDQIRTTKSFRNMYNKMEAAQEDWAS